MKQRVTITLDEEVLEQYRGLAHEGRTNLSKCINDWLAETAPALAQVTQLLKAAKHSPQRVVADLSLFSEQMGEELAELQGTLSAMAGEPDACAPARLEDAQPSGPSPKPQISPHSNTGLKPPLGNN